MPFVRELHSSKAQTPNSAKMTLFLLEKEIIKKGKMLISLLRHSLSQGSSLSDVHARGLSLSSLHI